MLHLSRSPTGPERLVSTLQGVQPRAARCGAPGMSPGFGKTQLCGPGQSLSLSEPSSLLCGMGSDPREGGRPADAQRGWSLESLLLRGGAQSSRQPGPDTRPFSSGPSGPPAPCRSRRRRGPGSLTNPRHPDSFPPAPSGFVCEPGGRVVGAHHRPHPRDESGGRGRAAVHAALGNALEGTRHSPPGKSRLSPPVTPRPTDGSYRVQACAWETPALGGSLSSHPVPREPHASHHLPVFCWCLGSVLACSVRCNRNTSENDQGSERGTGDSHEGPELSPSGQQAQRGTQRLCSRTLCGRRRRDVSAGRAREARGSCGAGLLGPPCSLSWRPRSSGCPSWPGLASGTQPGHWPREVCCLSLCCGAFPGRQVSAEARTKPSVTEQSRESRRPGGNGGLACSPASPSRSLARDLPVRRTGGPCLTATG